MSLEDERRRLGSAFAQGGAEYARLRPTYPRESVAWALATAPEGVVADVGAGTGKLTELVLDKIPAVDTVNDAVQSFIRPAMGGLMASASTAAASLDHSQWMKDNPWAGVVLGIVVAGIVHSGKMAARPVINAGTAGVGAPVVSTAEDGASVALSLAAVFAPVLAVLALLVLLGLIVWAFVAFFRLRRRRARRVQVAP